MSLEEVIVKAVVLMMVMLAMLTFAYPMIGGN